MLWWSGSKSDTEANRDFLRIVRHSDHRSKASGSERQTLAERALKGLSSRWNAFEAESLSGYIMGPAAAGPPFFLCNDWF